VASGNSQASKLSAGKAVVLLDSTGKVLQKFASQSEAGAALGLSPAQVSNAVRGSRVAKVGMFYIQTIFGFATFYMLKSG
jgi:hypothetical protein